MSRHLHRLSDIDPEARTGICAVCGLIKLWRAAYSRQGEPTFRCPESLRESQRRTAPKARLRYLEAEVERLRAELELSSPSPQPIRPSPMVGETRS